ncbi:MAG: hypothetical protein JWM76_230, partial [Pseudonocardiales bacterium]|nr:hypothetical protein [Pseudonocardiales bacterium]
IDTLLDIASGASTAPVPAGSGGLSDDARRHHSMGL